MGTVSVKYKGYKIEVKNSINKVELKVNGYTETTHNSLIDIKPVELSTVLDGVTIKGIFKNYFAFGQIEIYFNNRPIKEGKIFT